MPLNKYDAGPRPSRKKNGQGVWGGVAPPVGLGFGISPAFRVRVRPHYPELPVPGPRRDIGLGLGSGLGNISGILENVADSDFQYFQDPGECCRLRFPIFPGSQDTRKVRFPIFPGVQKYRKSQISNISRILENVGDFDLQYFQDSGKCCRPREPNNKT